MRMITASTVWQFIMPYLAMIMLPLVAVVIAFLKVVLDKLQHLSVKLESVDETAKATKTQTDGIISRMQDTIARKDVEADQLATVTDLKTQIAAAKASDREEPK
jgi:Mg2+/Co2+ transporter CorB